MDKESNYSDDEVKQILHSLFTEKKKNIELQQKLEEIESKMCVHENATQPPFSAEEFAKIQEKLASYEQSLYHEIDNNALLKKKVQALEERLHHSLSENQNLQRQLQEKNEKEGNSQEQITLRQKQQMDRLVRAIEEKDKVIASLRQYEYSFKLSNQQRIEFEATTNRKEAHIEVLVKEKEAFSRKCQEQELRLIELQKQLGEREDRCEKILAEIEVIRLVQDNAEEQLRIFAQQKKEWLDEKEKLLQTLNRVTSEKEDGDFELNAIRSQFDSLKKTIHAFQDDHHRLQELNQQKDLLVIQTQNEQESLKKKLHQKEGELFELHKELDLVKNTLMRGLRESKELESRFLELVNEKVGYVTKALQIQKTVDQQKIEMTDLKTKLNEERKVQEAFKEKWKMESAQNKQELQNSYENLAEKENHLKQLRLELEEQIRTHQDDQLKLESFERDKTQLFQKLEEAIALKEEVENRMKVAQQHLAKKVKDNALLNEKVEEQANYIQDLNNQLVVVNQKMSEAQQAYDLQLQQEKRLQDQLRETLKFAEGQISKWEEKYFHLYERWQEADKKNKELKGMEEKHAQLQNVLSTLGNVMGIASAAEQQVEPIAAVPPAEASPKIVIAEVPAKETPLASFEEAETNLFEHASTGPSRRKQTLFDE